MEWIKCSDRLPDTNREVLVNLRESGVFMGNFFDKKDWHLFYCDAGRQRVLNNPSVTHWTELPEPPTK